MYIIYAVYIFKFLSIVGYYRILNIVPTLHSKSLLFIYFMYNLLYLLNTYS